MAATPSISVDELESYRIKSDEELQELASLKERRLVCKVVCDESINSPEDIQSGRLNVEVRWALEAADEFIKSEDERFLDYVVSEFPLYLRKMRKLRNRRKKQARARTGRRRK